MADVHPVEWDNIRFPSFPANWKLLKTLPEEKDVCSLHFGPFSGFFWSSSGSSRAWKGKAIRKAAVEDGVFLWHSLRVCHQSLALPVPLPASPPTRVTEPDSTLRSSWKVYPLEALHNVGSTCWSLHRLSDRWIEGLIVGRLLFSTQDGLFSVGFYYQKAFKSAAEPLLNISQWIKYHFSPHSCSMWVSGESIFFFFPSGRRRLLYKPQHWGNEIICVRIL